MCESRKQSMTLQAIARYVIQVLLKPSILSVVDPRTVFGKHNESLVHLNKHAVYEQGHQRVPLLDGSLIELREASCKSHRYNEQPIQASNSEIQE